MADRGSQIDRELAYKLVQKTVDKHVRRIVARLGNKASSGLLGIALMDAAVRVLKIANIQMDTAEALLHELYEKY